MNIRGEDLKSKFNLSRYIYIMMIASVFIYAFVVNTIIKNSNLMNKAATDINYNNLKHILYGISFATFFIIKYTRKSLLSGKGNKGNPNLNSHPAIFSNLTIITAALCESVAIYGLVLFFIFKQTNDFYTLMFISLLYYLYFFPKYQQWEEWIKEYPLKKTS